MRKKRRRANKHKFFIDSHFVLPFHFEHLVGAREKCKSAAFAKNARDEQDVFVE
jgi:hypothetical protein